MSTAVGDNRQVMKLMKDWGFEEGDGRGGQIAMHYPGGETIKVIAPGRNTRNSDHVLQRAAAVVGVPLHDFRRGPKRAPRRVKPLLLQYERPATPLPQQNQKVELPPLPPPPTVQQPAPAASVLEPKRRQRPGMAVLTFLKAHPGMTYRVGELAERLGLQSPAVSVAIKHLMQSHPELQKGEKNGVYMWVNPTSPRLLPGSRALHGDCFTRLEQNVKGHIVLRGPRGELYLAAPYVEPKLPTPTFGPEEQWSDAHYIGSESPNGNGHSTNGHAPTSRAKTTAKTPKAPAKKAVKKVTAAAKVAAKAPATKRTPAKKATPPAVNRVAKPVSVVKATPAKKVELAQKRESQLVGA